MIIKNASVTDQVVEYLKENIESGAWAVGEKIPSENQLVAELGVSRSSIRTALQYLIGLGVLKSYQGKGTFLIENQVENWDEAESKITAEDCKNIQQVLEFRRILEPETCGMAVQRCTPAVIASMEHYLEQMKAYCNDGAKFVRADMRFHEAICNASGNVLIEKSLHKVFTETKRNHEQIFHQVGKDNGIQYHTMIIEAFRAGDSQRAKELMEQHLDTAIRGIQK